MNNQMHLFNRELVKKHVLIEINNFKRDNYILRNNVNWKNLLHIYMIHKKNGNRIDIFSYPEFGDIVIYKNNKKIKSYNIQCK